MRMIADETDRGERVSPRLANDGYYAHLSLYLWAAAQVPARSVLDAGCGTGYGTSLFAQAGAASATGLDLSSEAVAFARRHAPFAPTIASRHRAALTLHATAGPVAFEVGDLRDLSRWPDDHFDVVFTSNALEHVVGVDRFLLEAARVLMPEGRLVVAVPPCESEASRREMTANPFHVNIWSARQWHHALERRFGQVEVLRHELAPVGGRQVTLDFGGSAASASVTAEDFECRAVDEPEDIGGGLTAVYVARAPLPRTRQPKGGPDFVDTSFTRPMPSARARLAGTVPTEAPKPTHWRRWPARLAEAFAVGGPTGVVRAVRDFVRWHAIVRPARDELLYAPEDDRARKKQGHANDS